MPSNMPKLHRPFLNVWRDFKGHESPTTMYANNGSYFYGQPKLRMVVWVFHTFGPFAYIFITNKRHSCSTICMIVAYHFRLSI
jgi:hypothetical protein